MIEKKLIEELLGTYLAEHELTLYDVEWVKEFGYQILRVIVDKAGGIDVDTLALVNDYLSERLDNYDKDMPEYMLEVCSPGAEKELRTKDEILENVGAYVNVTTKDGIYEGTLLSYEGDTLIVQINIKGRMKKISILETDIKKIRLAVKI